MNKSEAKALAAQLGLEIKSADELADQVEARGWKLAIDNATADWVVLGDNEAELARHR